MLKRKKQNFQVPPSQASKITFVYIDVKLFSSVASPIKPCEYFLIVCMTSIFLSQYACLCK